MKNIILLLLAFLLVNNAKAQRWLPPGTTLTQSVADFKGMFLMGSKPMPIYINGPVMVHGKLCNYGTYKMGAALDTTIFDPLSFITYEDAGVVYWYRPVLGDFTVLFDFNKNVGDEWVIDGLFKGFFGEYCSRFVKVISKNMVNINGFNLRSMSLRFSVAPYAYINDVIEFIGGLDTPFPDHAPCYDGIVDDYSEFFGLRCIDHPDIGFYDFKIAPNCNHSATSVQESKKPELVNINPNPSTGLFVIKSTDPSFVGVGIKVYDITGRLLLQQELKQAETKLDMGQYASGVYLYQISQNGKNLYNGKLIKQ